MKSILREAFERGHGIKRRSGVLILAFVVISLIPSEASANTTKITWTYDDYRFANNACGFRVVFHASGPYKVTDQYDDDGDLYRTIVTSGGGGYHITARANGVTLTTESSYQIIYTYNADGSVAAYREDGLHFGFRVPGAGVILLDTGRIDFDGETGAILFETGPHMFREGEFEEFCTAFV
jgi:hypothetical protein